MDYHFLTKIRCGKNTCITEDGEKCEFLRKYSAHGHCGYLGDNVWVVDGQFMRSPRCLKEAVRIQILEDWPCQP